MFNIATEEEINKVLQGIDPNKIKARDIFEVKPIDSGSAYRFVSTYHYLGSAEFLVINAFGTVIKGTNSLVSVAVYSALSNRYSSEMWFGDRNDYYYLELSRLCTHPLLNKTNVSSYMLGRSLRILKGLKRNDGTPYCKAVVSLADASRHNGTIYRVCNFKYYGLTVPKSDFYDLDGHKNPRISTHNRRGVWLPRTQKHRYAYVLDKSVNVNYEEMPSPKYETLAITCCKGTKVVIDYRFGDRYSCPICCGKLAKIEEVQNG